MPPDFRQNLLRNKINCKMLVCWAVRPAPILGRKLSRMDGFIHQVLASAIPLRIAKCHFTLCALGNNRTASPTFCPCDGRNSDTCSAIFSASRSMSASPSSPTSRTRSTFFGKMPQNEYLIVKTRLQHMSQRPSTSTALLGFLIILGYS